MSLDKRRFRANGYADLTPMAGFAENAFVGCKLQIGTKAVIARCGLLSIMDVMIK